MPFLNWRQESLGQEISVHATLESQLTLTLSPALWTALATGIAELFAEGSGELRVDLPRGWIIFWKARASGSRLLLSHPDKDEYVATAALETAHAQALVARLREVPSGGTLVVSEAIGARLGEFSNVEIALTRLD